MVGEFKNNVPVVAVEPGVVEYAAIFPAASVVTAEL